LAVPLDDAFLAIFVRREPGDKETVLTIFVAKSQVEPALRREKRERYFFIVV
jgi:hypothetical protein